MHQTFTARLYFEFLLGDAGADEDLLKEGGSRGFTRVKGVLGVSWRALLWRARGVVDKDRPKNNPQRWLNINKTL